MYSLLPWQGNTVKTLHFFFPLSWLVLMKNVCWLDRSPLSGLFLHVSNPFQNLFLNKFTLRKYLIVVSGNTHRSMCILAGRNTLGQNNESLMVEFAKLILKRNLRLQEAKEMCLRVPCWLVVGWSCSSWLPIPHHFPFLLPKRPATQQHLSKNTLGFHGTGT